MLPLWKIRQGDDESVEKLHMQRHMLERVLLESGQYFLKCAQTKLKDNEKMALAFPSSRPIILNLQNEILILVV